MKFSILSVIGISLASSTVLVAVSGEDNKTDDETACFNAISKSQNCLKICGEKEATGDTDDNSTTTTVTSSSSSSTLLSECLGVNDYSTLDTCCQMDAECASTWSISRTCMTQTLTQIMEKSSDYIQCIREPGVCKTGGDTDDTCLTSLTSALQGGSTDIEEMASSATTCRDLDPLLTETCTTATGCCPACSSLVAGVVEAVTNDLLLPVYNRMDPVLTCPGMTCAGNEDGSSTPPVVVTTTTPETETLSSSTATTDTDAGVDLATECNTLLAQNIVLHNESYAAESFFTCLTKTTGTVMSTADDVEENGKGGGEEEDSSSASSFFGTSLMTTSSSFVSISIMASLSSMISIAFLIA